MSGKQVIRRHLNKRFIPNIFTILNMYLGFSAIVLLLTGDPIKAAWFVFIAAILDAFDGKLARLLGIETTFGTEFDSFADTISFCVTSSLLVYTIWTNGLIPALAIAFSFIPILLGTIRLAKFNLVCSEPFDRYTGLTTPAYANVLFGYVLFSNQLFGNYGDPRVGIVLTITMGMLMVSNIGFGKTPYFSFNRGRKNNIKLFSSIIVFASVIIFRGLTLFPILFLYIGWNILNALLQSPKLQFLAKIKPNRD